MIVSGSRNWNWYGVFEKAMVDVLSEIQYHYPVRRNAIDVVQGGAHGVDYMARKFAKKFKLHETEFAANWDNLDSKIEPVKEVHGISSGYAYNKLAGVNRNKRMLEYIKPSKYKFLVAFQMDKSRGVQDMLNLGLKENLPIYHFQTTTERQNILKLDTYNLESKWVLKYI